MIWNPALCSKEFHFPYPKDATMCGQLTGVINHFMPHFTMVEDKWSAGLCVLWSGHIPHAAILLPSINGIPAGVEYVKYPSLI